MSKKVYFLSLFLWLFAMTVPAMAQEKSDTTYTFRFVSGKDIFYIPWSGNGKELSRLLKAIEQNRTAIESGQMYIYVTSLTTRSSAEMAKIRRNRVKSELILHGGVKESHFVTDKEIENNRKDMKGNKHDYVVVMLPAPVDKVARIAGAEAAARVAAYNREVSGEAERERLAAEKKREEERLAKEQAEKERLLAQERAAREKAEAERLAAEQAERERLAREQAEKETHKPTSSTFALRANLLRWATLTPDLGAEWHVNKTWSIQLNGTWTSWTWDNKDRRYALWEILPEVRYHLGTEKRGYIGAMYHTGHFNYKLSDTGKQGDLMGGGLTGGYILPLGCNFSFDFTIGVGCTHAKFDKYSVIDGVRVKKGKESKNYLGVNRLGVSLVWNIF